MPGGSYDVGLGTHYGYARAGYDPALPPRSLEVATPPRMRVSTLCLVRRISSWKRSL